MAGNGRNRRPGDRGPSPTGSLRRERSLELDCGPDERLLLVDESGTAIVEEVAAMAATFILLLLLVQVAMAMTA
ncbi:MAG: hypothetical protein WD652_02860, partial [Acidimicrobiia bacterium]